MMTFANSLDSDQTRQNVGPDLDPNCGSVDLKNLNFFNKVDFEKESRQQIIYENYPTCKELKTFFLPMRFKHEKFCHFQIR